MPRRAARAVAEPALLSRAVGHVTCAPASLLTAPDAIEAFADRVGRALLASRQHGREVGFLAYAPGEPDRPLVPEDDAEGDRANIRWHWREPNAAVAFSFHTHPGPHAMCVPSGIDVVGALVRGDHLTYVLTMDGRLAGWRLKDREGLGWAVEDAMRALDDAKSLKRGFLQFLYDAFDAMRPDVLEPAYAARVALSDDPRAPAPRIARVDPAQGFFTPEEAPRWSSAP